MTKNLILFVGFFFLGAAALGGYYWWQNHNLPIKIVQTEQSSQVVNDFIEQAPKDSIRGQISTFSGEVKWQSRVATESTRLTETIQIQQGEKLSTGKDGKVTVVFGIFGSVEMSPKSEISVGQTLPVNFVFEQASGSARFVSAGQSPFSVRALHLLTTIASGSATIAVDEKNHVTSLNIGRGQVTIAYNDKQFVSQLLELKSGQEYEFDDDARQIYRL